MKLKKFLPSFSLFGYSILFPVRSHANEWVNRMKSNGEAITTDLEVWLPRVLNFAIGMAAIVCIAIIIGSGYMYITSSGDEEKVRKAGKSMTYAIVGLVICVISVILVEFVLKRVIRQNP